MRIGHQHILRRVQALTLLSLGATQASAAAAVGVSERTVRKWRALQKLNCVVPRGPLADALHEAYLQEQHSRARARIFSAMADLAQEEARLLRKRIQRGVVAVDLPEPESEHTPELEPDPAQQERARRIAARALEMLRSSSGAGTSRA